MSGRKCEMLPFIISFRSDKPKYIQIYEQIRHQIESKNIIANEKLPSIRTLADNLQVSRNTTLQAYEVLIAEGYIRSVQKKGYFVNQIESFFTKPSTIFKKELQREPVADMIDFRLGAIDQEHFPLKKWRQIASGILEQSCCYTYGESFGENILKQELSRYLLQARGMDIDSAQIIIGSSTQQLLFQLGLLLQQNFSSILLENPGYYGVHEVFKLLQLPIESISVTKNGLTLDELTKKNSSLIYVTPSHQYPFGTALSIQQRWKLLQWAHERQGFILEDDYDSEYRYGQKTFPALASLDSTRTIYFGTFSKAFLPGIRLSYMVLPYTLLQSYQQMFQHIESSTSLLHQLTMAEFMRSGEWERHLKRMRKIYQQKMNVLVESIRKHFLQNLNVIGEKAGLYVIISITSDYTEQELIHFALNEQIKVYPTSNLYLEQDDSNTMLLLGFANVSIKQIEEGIARLKKAWYFL